LTFIIYYYCYYYYPVQVLHLLENWLLNCYSCVKWTDSFFSQLFFKLDFSVRQGLVMSPLLFAVYVDDLAKCCDCSRGIYIVLYADDILLLTPTVSELHLLNRLPVNGSSKR